MWSSRGRSIGQCSFSTAAPVGNAGVEAVATVALILWIEATCGELMEPYFEEGEASVGFGVAVDHTGPDFTGRPVEVHAAVSGAAGDRVRPSRRGAGSDGRRLAKFRACIWYFPGHLISIRGKG